MSDQNCIYCGELVNYSSEPEFGETGDETPNGPAHHRCIAKARIEELETEVKHFRTKATRFEVENAALREDACKLFLKEMKADGDGFKMVLDSNPALRAQAEWAVMMLKEQGADSFLTTELKGGPFPVSITFQRMDGADTPAAKLTRLGNALRSVRERLIECGNEPGTKVVRIIDEALAMKRTENGG